MMANQLDIARIRAYAVRPPLMPAARYTGREQPTITNIEVVMTSVCGDITPAVINKKRNIKPVADFALET